MVERRSVKLVTFCVQIANVEKVTHEQFTKAVNEVEQKFM